MYKNSTTSLMYARQRSTDGAFAPLRARRSRRAPGKKPMLNRSPLVSFSALATVLFLALSFGRVGDTVSYFSDHDVSSGNLLRAGSLDFTVSADGSVDAYLGGEDGGGTVVVPILSPGAGSFPLSYYVAASKIAGPDAFCNAIQAQATTSPFIYSGALLSLSTGASSLTGPWSLALSLPSNTSDISQGDVCYVDLVYHGWHEGLPEGDGYSDTETVHLTLHARMVVINEFLPNPDPSANGFNFGDDADDKPNGEWVELYNNSDSAVNLAGWYIWDGSGTDSNKIPITMANTNLATTVIASHAWLVVYMNKPVFNNTGDEVRLYNSSDTLVDIFAYGSHDVCDYEPTPGDPNAPSGSGSGCVAVPPNKSYARIPDGLGGRLDPIPTPGKANRDSLEPETPDALTAALSDSFPETIDDATKTRFAVATTTERIATSTAATTTEPVAAPASDGGAPAPVTVAAAEISTSTATTTLDSAPAAAATTTAQVDVLLGATTTEETAIGPESASTSPIAEPPTPEIIEKAESMTTEAAPIGGETSAEVDEALPVSLPDEPAVSVEPPPAEPGPTVEAPDAAPQGGEPEAPPETPAPSPGVTADAAAI